jgi:hypothetical protein
MKEKNMNENVVAEECWDDEIPIEDPKLEEKRLAEDKIKM